MIDRFLYRLGLVRRSHFDELREASENMLVEYDQYRKEMYEWQSNHLHFDQEITMPQSPVFKLIQGGKQ